MQLRSFEPSDRAEIVDLWRRCELLRSWNDPDLDIDRKVDHDPEGFVVGEVDGRVVAAAMFGYDGHRGSVNYLAVDPDLQSAGHGRTLMAHIEAQLVALGCPKVNLMVRSSNTAVLEFYSRLGYEVDEAVSLGRRLIHDEPER